VLDEANSDVAVRDFINSVEGLHDALKVEAQPTLVNFVVKTKVKGCAKTKIGDETAATMADLKTLLITKCGSTETIESLSIKMKEAKQGAKSVESFAAEIENVAEKMAAIEISASEATTQETKKAIRNMCFAQAVVAFKNGINTNLKSTVVASRPKTLQDTVQVAIATEAVNLTETNAVLYANSNESNNCYNCNKSGHLARDCRYKQAILCHNFNKQGNRGSNQNNAYFSSTEQTEDHNNGNNGIMVITVATIMTETGTEIRLQTMRIWGFVLKPGRPSVIL
jgi:Zinc knuckle